ncbi:MAG: VTT domain-containing protein [Streptomyces sp.]|nr:VTT domain-containing protein [Streptomyces sp.]NUR66563.1 VTT domain-containing protein [Streptomyces sp.]NUS29722.1 VTT domain-containing protein [Streptomyces sp.]NUS75717.1 VTT domain-containing protein [Streptomyces sp.]
MRWFWLVIGLFAAILVPFFLFGGYFDGLASQAAEHRLSTSVAVMVIAGLLALDVFLPVPSSVVSAAAGVLLGFGWGTAVVWAGMTVSCALGYLVGARSESLTRQLVGEAGLARAADGARRHGLVALALCRPVPVLAEASVVLAGATRVRPGRFLLVCAWSNLGVAVVYAGVGAWSVSVNSFALAFLAAMAFPGLALVVTRMRSGWARVEEVKAEGGGGS